jgi:hypothetical protein
VADPGARLCLRRPGRRGSYDLLLFAPEGGIPLSDGRGRQIVLPAPLAGSVAAGPVRLLDGHLGIAGRPTAAGRRRR